MKLKILSVVAVLGLGVGCQTYDFEPVLPLAVAQTTQSKSVAGRNLKPDLMFLIDNSGSMNFGVKPTTGCNCPNSACPAGCPTRITELKSAMNTFLTQNGGIARMGMTIFPKGAGMDECVGTSGINIEMSTSNDVDAELKAKANDVNTAIAGLTPAGGTPTAQSLLFLKDYAPLADPNREDFVVLLTDGLPNCAAQNPNNECGGTNAACRCTLAAATCSNASYCSLKCLDKDGSVKAIEDLRAKNIRTIVVGFGAETNAGDGPEALNAMAAAGGFPLACPNGTNAECGADNTCDMASKVCTRKFYQAANGQELATALKAIGDIIGQTDVCSYKLDSAPSDPRFLAVIVNEQSLKAGADTWKFDANPPTVTFLGSTCTKIKQSTPADRARIEFRIIESL